jgi:hypothetical protein
VPLLIAEVTAAGTPVGTWNAAAQQFSPNGVLSCAWLLLIANKTADTPMNVARNTAAAVVRTFTVRCIVVTLCYGA